MRLNITEHDWFEIFPLDSKRIQKEENLGYELVALLSLSNSCYF
jgi:hypothetical protein